MDITDFQCPACGNSLGEKNNAMYCPGCTHQFKQEQGIQQLYWPNDWDSNKLDVTNSVKAFYEGNPFPNYDEFDSIDSLARKAKKGLFARMLDEQIPTGIRIMECGCGTAQLSNFLSIRNRDIIAADLCLNSLKLGQQFADKHSLDTVTFVQMNLFRPPFKTGSFNLVICNGVLHHTADPRTGFDAIARLVKPGGYILIGLYHFWGRMITNLRRQVFNYSGDRFKFLDPNLKKNISTSAIKKNAWFLDQYKHPHESKHTIREIQTWLDEEGFDFVNSIPSTHLFENFNDKENLFAAELPADKYETLLTEVLEIFNGYQEGGFFTMIGRKRI